jgi:hypothetical protein
VVPYRGGVLVMFDDPLSLLSLGIWLFAAGMWPVAFLFGACSACCQDDCPWLLNFDRCLSIGIIDSSPPEGGDTRIRLANTVTLSGLQGVGAGFSDPGRGPIQVYQVASEIQVSIRLSLSASGASRTPVGETRTQVWRFNRATPTSPPATTYDVLGPGWHLQVDLSVTGVANEADAGVVSSIGSDEFGQPKLILQVNQWTANITRDEVVTLFPVGLQRWAGFRLTASTATATRVSGDNYTGWTVSKLFGLATQQERYAVRVLSASENSREGLPSFLGIGTFTQRVFLDDQVALDFLNGDAPIQVPVTAPSSFSPTGNCELRILADNVICGIPSGRMEIGIPLGVYPEFCTLAVTDPVITALGGFFCGPVTVAMRPAAANFSDCISEWKSSYVRRTASASGVTASPSDFYSGKTLLWNLEYGPYRTSFSKSQFNKQWNISLGGDGEFSSYDLPLAACPSGAIAQNGDMCPSTQNTALLSWEADVEVMTGVNYTGAFPNCGDVINSATVLTGIVTISGSRVVAYTPGVGADFWSTPFFGAGFSGQEDLAIMAATSNDQPGINLLVPTSIENIFFSCGFVEHRGRTFRIQARTQGIADACATGQTLEKEELVEDHSEGIVSNVSGFLQFFGSPPPPILVVEKPVIFGIPTVQIGQLAPMVFRVELDLLDSPSWSEAPRTSCTNWSQDTIPPEGETVTRTCSNETTVNYSLSRTFGPSRLRVPRLIAGTSYLGTENIVRSGSCSLIGLRRFNTGVTGTTLFLSAASGLCYYFVPEFGTGFTDPGTGDTDLCSAIIPSFQTEFLDALVRPRGTPCDNCVLSVEVISGEEVGRVRYIADGDKAGLVEVVAITTWLGGQGITFTVTCGADTITQVIRRADTAPTPPQNLTVVREPCSEAFLEWEAPEWNGGQPITAYSVQFRRIGATAYTTFATVSPTTFSATITGLVRVGYEFRVLAVNSVGNSAQSNVVANGFALGAPTSLTFTRDPCNEVQLSWVAPTQSECVVVANYRLEYRVGISGTFLAFGTVAGTATAGTITGLDPTLAYQFRVARIADDGPDLVSGTVTSGTPAAPTGVVPSLGTNPGEVDLTWNAVEQQCFPNTDYLVQFRPSTTSTWSDFARAASTDKFATVTGLTPATYFFRVRATNSIGNGNFSAQSNSVTIPEPE